MDMTHVHLLLNHVPTIGFGIALAMFVIALLMKNAELKRAALVLFVGVGMLTIPTYVSGNSAAEVICAGGTRAPACTDALVSKTLIQTHEGAASWLSPPSCSLPLSRGWDYGSSAAPRTLRAGPPAWS